MADQDVRPVDYADEYDALAEDILGDEESESSEDFSWLQDYEQKGKEKEEDSAFNTMLFDFRRGAELWPKQIEIIDDKKAEELLEEAKKKAAEKEQNKKKEGKDDKKDDKKKDDKKKDEKKK
jgi:hypothetical protein